MDEETSELMKKIMELLGKLKGNIGEMDKTTLMGMAFEASHAEDFETTKDSHQASHDYLAKNAERLKLADIELLVSKGGDHTYIGDLVTAGICTMLSVFENVVAEATGQGIAIQMGSKDGPKVVDEGDHYLVSKEKFVPWVADITLMCIRLGVAHEKGDLKDYADARQALVPNGLQNWVVADEDEDKS